MKHRQRFIPGVSLVLLIVFCFFFAGCTAFTKTNTGNKSVTSNTPLSELKNSTDNLVSSMSTASSSVSGQPVSGNPVLVSENGIPQPGPVNFGDTNPGNPATINALKTEIQQKFGLTVVDGTTRSIEGGDQVTAGQWTEAELRELIAIESALPAIFRGTINKVEKNGSIVRDGYPDSLYGVQGPDTIHLAESSTRDGEFRNTYIHERMHSVGERNPGIESAWASLFWQQVGQDHGNTRYQSPNTYRYKTEPPTPYARTNPIEDLAESTMVAHRYKREGRIAQFQQSYPDRYDFLVKYGLI